MTFRGIALFLFMLLVTPSLLRAQAGGAGLSFLKIGADARAIAMGDAGVVVADHGAAMYYNPALVADDTEASVTIMHNEWVQDLSTEYLGVVVPFKAWTLGVHMGLTSVEGIEIRQRPGDPEGTFDSRNFAGGLSAAFGIAQGVRFGASVKYVLEKIYTDAADGYAFDLGVTVAPLQEGELRTLRFGLAVANLGSMSELRALPTTLPALLRAGVAWDADIPSLNSVFTVTGGAMHVFDDEVTHVQLGAEFDYSDAVYARLGYQSGFDIKDVSFGAGAKYHNLRFDYAYTPFSESFGTAHTIALSINI